MIKKCQKKGVYENSVMSKGLIGVVKDWITLAVHMW